MAEQPQQTELVTVDTALANAARLLRHAEGETDRHLMERIEKLADSWVSIAGILVQRERT